MISNKHILGQQSFRQVGTASSVEQRPPPPSTLSTQLQILIVHLAAINQLVNVKQNHITTWYLVVGRIVQPLKSSKAPSPPSLSSSFFSAPDLGWSHDLDTGRTRYSEKHIISAKLTPDTMNANTGKYTNTNTHTHTHTFASNMVKVTEMFLMK